MGLVRNARASPPTRASPHIKPEVSIYFSQSEGQSKQVAMCAERTARVRVRQTGTR